MLNHAPDPARIADLDLEDGRKRIAVLRIQNVFLKPAPSSRFILAPDLGNFFKTFIFYGLTLPSFPSLEKFFY
jgi:hypothetical protein